MTEATKLGSLVVTDLLSSERAVVAAISTVSQALHTTSSSALQLDDPRANFQHAYAGFAQVLAALATAHGELTVKTHKALDVVRKRLNLAPAAIGVPEGKDEENVFLPRGERVDGDHIVA